MRGTVHHAICLTVANLAGLPRVWRRLEAALPMPWPIDTADHAADSTPKCKKEKRKAAPKI